MYVFCMFLSYCVYQNSSAIISSTSSFVIYSVQLFFSTLLHVHISKASNLFISSFIMVHEKQWLPSHGGNEAELFIIVILWGKIIFFCHLKGAIFCILGGKK